MTAEVKDQVEREYEYCVLEMASLLNGELEPIVQAKATHIADLLKAK